MYICLFVFVIVFVYHSQALTLEQTLDTIRINARFTEMKSALQEDPENFAKRVLDFCSKLSPVMAEAVERYEVHILRYMYEDFQVFV